MLFKDAIYDKTYNKTSVTAMQSNTEKAFGLFERKIKLHGWPRKIATIATTTPKYPGGSKRKMSVIAINTNAYE